MKQFIALYFLFIALLFSFFYFPSSSLSIWLNNEQRELTLYILTILLEPHQVQGSAVWVNPHYKINITQACNGMIPILFLFASILAYPSKWSSKFIWMIFGYVVFSIINILRLLFVIYITKSGKGYEEFHWSHDIIGNALLLVTGLSIFILYIKSVKE